MDHFRDFLRVLKPGHFSGYYHVPVAHSSQPFLGFVVMGTANHYLLDVVGGLVTLLVGFILAWLLRMAWRAYLARHLDPQIVTQLSAKGAA